MMMMRSLRQFQIRAVTAGAMRLTFLLPNARFHTRDVVVLGVTNFSRAGKYERLNWPPQTLFAEYNSKFTKNPGALGYAKPVSMKGHLVLTHLIRNNRDREFAILTDQQLTATEIKLFKRWLNSPHHPQIANWQQVVRNLTHAIEAFGNHKLDLETLIRQFEQYFAQVSPHDIHRAKTLAQQARSIAAKFDRKLHAQLPVTYLLINVQNVTHFLYRDERDILFNTDVEDATHRKAGDFNRFMFDRIQLQKAEFTRRGIPFYDPTWLASQRVHNQPVWELSQLDAYHLEE